MHCLPFITAKAHLNSFRGFNNKKPEDKAVRDIFMTSPDEDITDFHTTKRKINFQKMLRRLCNPFIYLIYLKTFSICRGFLLPSTPAGFR
jgi:hypothetical protein